MTCISGRNMDTECTQRCTSKKHADKIFAAISKDKEYEDKVLSFMNSCHNVATNRDSIGRTALHIAAAHGRMKIISWLLSKEASVNAKDSESGYSALHRAVYFGQLQAARYLLNNQANLFQTDHDSWSSMDHMIQDRASNTTSCTSNQLSEIYVWGSNDNYSLGLDKQASRNAPEPLDFFRKDKISIVQVAMNKFHSVFLDKLGQVYSCGHGRGGRLGQGSENSALTPTKLVFAPEACKLIAVGTDHSIFLTEDGKVWTCGLNQYHQLGHSPSSPKELLPKCINSFHGKAKSVSIQGVCASRFHSVFWTSTSLYTCGLNAGALGHLKGDKTIAIPKQVTSLSAHEDVIIAHVAVSDGATAVATNKGDVYILHEYQCRKIVSKQFDLGKIVMVGGKLDPNVLDEDQIGRSISLQVLLLTTSGNIYIWQQSNPVLTRCFFRLGHPLYIKDVALGNSSMVLISKEGEAFNGRLFHKESKKSDASQAVQRTSSWKEFAKREQCYQIKVQRIPHVYHAVSVACDPEEKNFAVVQVNSSLQLLDEVKIVPSKFLEDMTQLLDEATPDDLIHDVIFIVGGRVFPAHRFVLASSSGEFYKKLCAGDKNEIQVDDIPQEFFQKILEFIYTGSCSPPAPSFRPEPSLSSSISGGADSARDVNFDERTPDRKENRSEDKPGSELHGMRSLQSYARKLGVNVLANMIDKAFRSTSKYHRELGVPYQLSAVVKPFSRAFARKLCDVKIRSEDGKDFDAHRVVLSARLDYFRSMFNCGWIESTKTDALTLPIHSSVLEVILDYLYEDRALKIENSDDIGWIGNCLVVADQLIIPRLVSICESALVGLLTLKNVGQILEFSSIYNAGQLKRACMQYICLNLPAVVEMRTWNCVSEEVMEDLTDYYRQTNPCVMKRWLFTSADAPSDDILDEYDSLQDKVTTLLDSSREQRVKRVKARRKTTKGGPSEVKERQVSISSIHSVDSIEDEVIANVASLAITKPEKVEWSKVERTKKASRKSISEPEKITEPSPSGSSRPSIPSSPKKDSFLNQPAIPDPTLESMVSPSKHNLTLFELAVVSKTSATSPSASAQKSKKFPKLSQKQRRQQGSSDPTSEPPPVLSTSPWKTPTDLPQSNDDIGASNPASSIAIKSPWDSPEKGKCVPDAQSPLVNKPATSMRSIIATEKQQHLNSTRVRSKSLKLTLMEDLAIADLNDFYQTDRVDDEHITVERVVPDAFASPVWSIPRASQKARLYSTSSNN